MEVDVDAGIALELASKTDLEGMFTKLGKKIDPYRRKILAGNSAIVPASGVVQFRVYDVPDNFVFTLGKFVVWGDAHNPSSGGIYTNAGAWGGLFHGNPSPANIAEFWPKPEASTFQILPYTYEYGAFQAPEWRPPDNVQFQGTGFPVGENITVLLFGLLSEQSWA